MKKHLFFYALAAITLCAGSLLFTSCGEDDEEPAVNTTGSIIGEWSGIFEDEELNGDPYQVAVHFNFKEDGTFEQIMPHWEEKRCGKYTISGDIVTFKLTSLSWLWNRCNGYENVYDQYGCWWEDYDNGVVFPDPMAKYAEDWPDRTHFSAKYYFDKAGRLHLDPVTGEGAGYGLQLVYHKNPGFTVTKRED